MIRRERKKQLEIERDKEIEIINKKYAPAFEALNYTFSLPEIESAGWVRGDPYRTRGNKNEWEYDKKVPTHSFWTKTVYIIFDDKNGSIKDILAGTPQRSICDMEDLNYFFETGK